MFENYTDEEFKKELEQGLLDYIDIMRRNTLNELDHQIKLKDKKEYEIKQMEWEIAGIQDRVNDWEKTLERANKLLTPKPQTLSLTDFNINNVILAWKEDE